MDILNDSSFAEIFKTDEAFTQTSVAVANEIASNDYAIGDFVEKLGFALASPVTELRVKGTKLLSSVLCFLPKDHLNRLQLEFIARFYADRMNDQHNVLPAVIDGIAGLINMKNLPDDSIVIILQSCFQHIPCQSQTRSDRTKIFKILKQLSENHEDILKSMGGDFIYGVINSIDGERDPRNLEFIFTFMPGFIDKYPLLHLYEEMFEIFACYFPIDFNPSKNDADVITRDNLAKKLLNCLVASEKFIEWLVPLALEKLESQLVVAKLDSLELLSAIAVKYTPKSLENHFKEIWPVLKHEILPGQDNLDVISRGLETLRFILECASKDPNISQNFQTTVLSNVLPHLDDIHQRLFNPSTKIAIVCVSGDAKFASEKILNTFLLKLHSENVLSSQDKLQIFCVLAQVYKLTSFKNALMQINTNINADLHSELIKELKSDTSSTDLKKAALSCFNESLACSSQENRFLMYECLVQILTSNELEIDLKDILRHTAEIDSKVLQCQCVDKVIRNFSTFSAYVKRKIYKNFLHLIKFSEFSQIVYTLIFSNIFKEVCPEVRLIALEALIKLLQEENAAFVENLQMNESLIDKIFSLVQSEMLNLETFESCACVLSLIMRHLPVAEQYMILSQYIPKLNLQVESDLFLSKGLLGFMNESISIDEHFKRITDDLLQISLTSENERLRKVCHHLLCSLFNKMEDNITNRSILQGIIQNLKEEIKQNKANSVEILAWIGKGLSIRGHDVFGYIIQIIADLLDHPTLNSEAKLAFDIISSEYPVLHLPCTRFLFKQKNFNIIYSIMSKKLDLLSENHINAFIHVLKATPHTVVKMNIEKIGPVLFKCLESTEVQTVHIALEICENFVKTKDNYFEGHFHHLVPQCLILTQFKSSMNVRITSLNLLYEITKWPAFVLLPLKMDVVLGLSYALNDRKRLVRNAAVRTSNAWYLIGQPTGD